MAAAATGDRMKGRSEWQHTGRRIERRASLWQRSNSRLKKRHPQSENVEIMMYALNNTSTNTYMLVVGYISYFLIGIVGLASVLAGSIVTIMRVWDGVTDPFVGMMSIRPTASSAKTVRSLSSVRSSCSPPPS